MPPTHPLGRELPATSSIWKLYYRTVGVPSFRSQLFWHHLIRVLRGVDFSTVLDVGCGAGGITVGLAKAWPRARFVGIDKDASSIALARAYAERAAVTNVEWSASTFQEFHGGSFDVVISLGLFEFVSEPATDLKSIAGFAQDGGLLVITTPHARTNDERLRGRHTRSEMLYWMIAAGCSNPEILELSKGLAHRVYVGSQRLQERPLEAAAYHLMTFPIVYADQKLPGAGDLLFCFGRISRD